jgi:enoyl-CoA hydratase
MTYETIRFEPGPVARIVLDRPQVLNAQDRRMLRELDHAFSEAANDPEIRVIVVSGEGEHFSAGHDVKEIANRDRAVAAGERPITGTELKDVYVDSHLRWRNVLKPTIAMIHGYCIFGGWMLASAMDFAFAADDLKLLAYPAPADYWSVIWELRPRKALELLYENRFVMADEALELGFVNRVYPRADLERETLAYAQRVAENDQAGIRALKLHVNQTLDGMGFSQSVTAAFHALRGPDGVRGGRGEPRVETTDGRLRFRNVAPALERLRRSAEEAADRA